MPLQSASTSELSGADISGLINHWSLPESLKKPDVTDETSGSIITALEQLDSMIGTAGEPRDGAGEIDGTDGLVVESRVGRGNVVLTRFDLTSGWMRKWKSASGFYNGALLRRPPRDYSYKEFGFDTVFAGMQSRTRHDARYVSGVRLVSRDSSVFSDNQPSVTDRRDPGAKQGWIDSRFEPTVLGGVASWNDSSGLCERARASLKESAGITIPPAKFVGRSLAWYLAILVPCNYLVFRVLSRLEWAWLAVPAISIAGAVWVARAAQLDIGFARSRNEIALLELQAGYDRAHLTRIFALYNSLSTPYDLEFESRDAVAAPMTIGNSSSNSATQFVSFRHGFDSGIQVTDFRVASNSTELMHTEEMLRLDGGISLSADNSQITNGTQFDMENVNIGRRNADGDLELAAIGPLLAGEQMSLEFVKRKNLRKPDDLPDDIFKLLQFALAQGQLGDGQYRLVGRIADTLPGVQVIPAASQVTSQTIVVAALREQALPPAKPDSELRPAINYNDGEDFSEEIE